jgi:hypothetical protein
LAEVGYGKMVRYELDQTHVAWGYHE